MNGGADHFGFSISGAAAELFRIRADWAHKLPDDVPYQAGATVEPFSCAYYALYRVGWANASDTVAVIGGGPIGLSAVAAAAAMGARVVLLEPMAHRRAAATALGADVTLDPAAGDPVEALRELTGGRLAEVVIEASGNPAGMASAFDLVGFSGRIAFVGINVGSSAPARLGQIQSKERPVSTARSGRPTSGRRRSDSSPLLGSTSPPWSPPRSPSPMPSTPTGRRRSGTCTSRSRSPTPDARSRMRAVRYHARGDIRVEQVVEPGDPAPGQVLVKPLWCGILWHRPPRIHSGTNRHVCQAASPHRRYQSPGPRTRVLGDGPRRASGVTAARPGRPGLGGTAADLLWGCVTCAALAPTTSVAGWPARG